MATAMRLAGLAALAGAVLAAELPAQARACGVERWPVKVAVDADARRVDTVPVATSISVLRGFPRPRPLPYNSRVAPQELRTYRVRAILAQILTESDGDWHLVLADPNQPTLTLIGEIPDAACALGSPHAAEYTAARRDLRGAPRGATIDVVGIGFFDYIHGQRGVAPNGFELHPILLVSVVAGAPAAADTVTSGPGRVWVNSASNVYHCPGTRYYGATKAGYYTTETKARAAGARPAYGRPCS